jgi:hypothetical protein
MDVGIPIAAQGPQQGNPAAKRRVRNYLLDTHLQLRLASYLIAVAVALSIVLGWLLWNAYSETSRVVALADPDVGESIAKLLAREDRVRMIWLAGALALLLVCLLAASVVITHRIAGPAFVIARTCRAVGDGSLARPRPLREHDLLTDLADDVANMIDALRGREEAERAVLAEAAAQLRNADATSVERDEAATRLDRVAAEKTKRLAS